jgi:hypothetical protein
VCLAWDILGDARMEVYIDPAKASHLALLLAVVPPGARADESIFFRALAVVCYRPPMPGSSNINMRYARNRSK